VAGLTKYSQPVRARSYRRARGSDVWWVALVGGLAAVVLAWLVTLSVQGAWAFVLVVAVIALHQYDRRYGIAAMFAFWFLGPMLRRLFLLLTGPVSNDPLSLAPFIATAAIAGLEFAGTRVPFTVRRVMLLAVAGIAIGLPLGLVSSPEGAMYASLAYLTGVCGAVLGYNERPGLRESNLRRVLLFGMVPIAIYAILQRSVPLPPWDRAWLNAFEFTSIGGVDTPIRVYASLNGPGTLAPLLGLALLCCLTVRRHPKAVLFSAVILTIALSLTFVRSAWVALIAAGIAHVIASEGRSARLIGSAAAVVVVATLALAPVSNTAADVVSRFSTIGQPSTDQSAEARRTSFEQLLPVAASAPLGHGLGSAGEATRLHGETDLRAVDNGYLSIMYQVGPVGFMLVMIAIFFVARAAWNGARSRAPGQEFRLLLFAMLVYLLVMMTSGDVLYGPSGVILWFIGGQALAYEWRRAASQR
jgi:putative inorganic carbon (hco3(-)) transporter